MAEEKKKEALYTKLSDKIVALLQRQVKHELENSHLYLAMSNYCDDMQYIGSSKFFEKQSLEERGHGKIFSSYLLDKKVKVPSPVLEGFECNYTDLTECFFASLKRETITTAMIKQIADAAFSEKDYQTYELALKMLKEQVEEEAMFINILDRWKILENCPNGLFLLDQDIEERYVK